MNVKKIFLVAISSLCVFAMLVVCSPTIDTMADTVDYTADITLNYVLSCPIEQLLNNSDLSERQISAIYNVLLPYFTSQLNARYTSGSNIHLLIPFAFDVNDVSFYDNPYPDYRNYNLVGDFTSSQQTFTLTLDVTDLPNVYSDAYSLRDYPLFYQIWLENIVSAINTISLSSDINFSVTGSRRSSGGHYFYDLTFTVPRFSARCYTRKAYFDTPIPHLTYWSTNPDNSDIVWTSYNPNDPTYNNPNVNIEGVGSSEVIDQPTYEDSDPLTPSLNMGEQYNTGRIYPVIKLNGEIIFAGLDNTPYRTISPSKNCSFNLLGMFNYLVASQLYQTDDDRLPYVSNDISMSYDPITDGLVLSYGGYDFSVSSWHFTYGYVYHVLGITSNQSEKYSSPLLDIDALFSGTFPSYNYYRCFVIDLTATPYSNSTPITFDIVGSSSSHGDYDNWDFINSPKLFLKRNYSPVTILLENINQSYLLDEHGNKVAGYEYERVIDGNGNEYLKETHYMGILSQTNYWSIDSFSYVLDNVIVTENPYFNISSIGSSSNIDFTYTVHLVDDPFEFSTENVLPDTPSNPTNFSDYFDFEIPVSILHSSTIFMFIFGLITTIPEIAILCVVLAILGILRTMRDK